MAWDQRQRLEVVLYSPLKTVSARVDYREITAVDKEEALCVQYLYSFTASWGCFPSLEDMARDIGLSAQILHKYARNLELKGVVNLQRMLFRHNVQLLINPSPIVPGRQLITRIEAHFLCVIYNQITTERPYVTVKELLLATGIIESMISKILNELDKNGVIKRARVGRQYAIEPSLPLTPVSHSVVEEDANSSEALPARQETLLGLILAEASEHDRILLEQIYKNSNVPLDVFVEDLSRLEMLNKIITHRSQDAYQCFIIPNRHKLVGVWPTPPFKSDLMSLGTQINAAQESLLLFYEMHLMKYGSAPPVGKLDRNTTVALAKKNVLVNNGHGVYHIFKTYPGHIADIDAPYLTVENLEVLRQMKAIIGQRFIGKCPDVDDVFKNELLRDRHVCPMELAARLYMTQDDLHKHSKTLRLFRKIKKPAEYYSDWDKTQIYL